MTWIFLVLISFSWGEANQINQPQQSPAPTINNTELPALSVSNVLKINQLGTQIRQLQNGKPQITGVPTFKKGICFGDGTCQTTVSTATIISTSANNLVGGLTNEVPYQSAPNQTSFTGQPGANSVLFSNSNAPSWTNTPTLTGTNITGVPGTLASGASANGIVVSSGAKGIAGLPVIGIGGLIIGTGGWPSTGTITNNASTIITAAASSITIAIDPASGTLQGNLFNSAGKLVQTNGSNFVPVSLIDGSSITEYGSLVNGNDQLIKTTASGKFPALDGSLITNLPTASMTFVLDDFSTQTTGSQFVFNLSTTPGVSSFTVVLDGLVQRQGKDYFYYSTGPEITFITAPRADSVSLLVQYPVFQTNNGNLFLYAPQSVIYSASGTYTFTYPPNVYSLNFKGCGPGSGGSQGSAGNGGAGAFWTWYIGPEGPQTLTVYIGSGTAGKAGGNTDDSSSTWVNSSFEGIELKGGPGTNSKIGGSVTFASMTVFSATAFQAPCGHYNNLFSGAVQGNGANPGGNCGTFLGGTTGGSEPGGGASMCGTGGGGTGGSGAGGNGVRGSGGGASGTGTGGKGGDGWLQISWVPGQ